jgi:hypothetical protein
MIKSYFSKSLRDRFSTILVSRLIALLSKVAFKQAWKPIGKTIRDAKKEIKT